MNWKLSKRQIQKFKNKEIRKEYIKNKNMGNATIITVLLILYILLVTQLNFTLVILLINQRYFESQKIHRIIYVQKKLKKKILMKKKSQRSCSLKKVGQMLSWKTPATTKLQNLTGKPIYWLLKFYQWVTKGAIKKVLHFWSISFGYNQKKILILSQFFYNPNS